MLARLLARGGRTAESVRATWSRSTLHRWTTGRQLPDVGNAVHLASLTHGRVSVRGWGIAAEQPQAAESEPAAEAAAS